MKNKSSKKVASDKSERVWDSRHPTYLGTWKKSVPYIDEDIARDDLDEPHVKRKLSILEKYPNIIELYGTEPLSKFIAVLVVASQVGAAYLFGKVLLDSTWFLVLCAYFIGASMTQVQGVLIHEATHNLITKGDVANRLYGIFANIGLVVPIAMSFRRYHLEHHAFQGVDGKDPDLPLPIEHKLVRGNALLKFIWLFFFPLLYCVRGLAMQRTPNRWEVFNLAAIVVANIAITYFCGSRGFLYLFLAMWFGYGIHPAAAHFIQEHYTFDDGQETYSYYGSFNRIFMNIGYHNEHHDFAKVCELSVGFELTL
jgi:sphingolipid delta-4 desaturase